METLIEAFPCVFGLLLGATCMRFGGLDKHLWAWALSCVVLGGFATVASGEWNESLLYFLFDIALVAGVSMGTIAALHYMRRRSVTRSR